MCSGRAGLGAAGRGDLGFGAPLDQESNYEIYAFDDLTTLVGLQKRS
jgi:hypothetical protein